MSTSIKAYFIQCITNMHAGSGDANYGVVDKLVQRDPVTGFPCIHASSLKGALREHAEMAWGKTNSRVLKIFGTDATESQNTKSGSYRFFSTDLLALPVRCNYRQFVHGLSKSLTRLVNQKSSLLTGKPLLNEQTAENTIFTDTAPSQGYEVYAEDTKLNAAAYTEPLACNPVGFTAMKNQFACFSDTDFAYATDNLPVIARNYLVDGTSKNLWYEEVVPHQTIFVTYTSTDQPDEEFEKLLSDTTIQIGGNATVGYGLCKFFPVKS